MEDLHWGMEQHLIKSMFVFCLMSFLLFLVLSVGTQRKLAPLYTHTYIHTYTENFKAR